MILLFLNVIVIRFKIASHCIYNAIGDYNSILNFLFYFDRCNYVGLIP